MRIVLATGERLAGVLVKSLLKSDHEVLEVVSPITKNVMARQYKELRYWRMNIQGWDLRDSCLAARIPIRIARDLNEGSVRASLKRLKPDLLVVFSWPKLVSDATLDIFPYGGMNIHPSMLPTWRGGDPLFSIIDSGGKGMGISFHRMIQELDAGPIFLQAPLPFYATDCYDDLYLRTLRHAGNFLPAALESLRQTPEGEAQEGLPLECPPFKIAMTQVGPESDPATLEKRCRACYPHHPMSFFIGKTKYRFKLCLPLGPSKEPNGKILKVGWSRLEIVMSGQRCLFTHCRPWGWPSIPVPLGLLGLRVGKSIQAK